LVDLDHKEQDHLLIDSQDMVGKHVEQALSEDEASLHKSIDDVHPQRISFQRLLRNL
jgi:hypothetical protein